MVETVDRIPRAIRWDLIDRDVVLVLQRLDQRLTLCLVYLQGPEHVDIYLVAADSYWHDALIVIRFCLLAASLAIHTLHEVLLHTVVLTNHLADGSLLGYI